jgi:hypothetical protein
MGCCSTHDAIRFTIDVLRETLAIPNLSDQGRQWLEQKLIEAVEREAILVEMPDGTQHSGSGQSTSDAK